MNHSDEINQIDWDAVDSPPISDELLTRMKPVRETHPDMPARVRGPQKTPTKIPVSIRLNPEVVDYFKSQGTGWQTRINEILAEYVTNCEDNELE
jgi:uncharacterized protein (DUF4415 family)